MKFEIFHLNTKSLILVFELLLIKFPRFKL